MSDSKADSKADTHFDGTTPSPGAVAAISEAPPVVAGRYEVLGLVGAGGMGTVYRALDRELDEVVALKMLRRELTETPGMLARFRQEVKLARRVTHPAVARTFDIGDTGAEKFLTMEYIEGESLAKRLARDGGLAIPLAVAIARQLCEGLGAAHAVGVIHRDLKPDNVLLAAHGRVVITDFGTARAHLESDPAQTGGNAFIGTPAYMAPEQVEGLSVDVRADLYALGAALYEMLVGVRAWPGPSALQVASARLVLQPPDPRRLRADVPDPLADIVLRLMARRREDRYQSAVEVDTVLADLPGVAPPSGRAPVQRITFPPPVVPSSDRTVAVLPFRNTGQIEDEYVADGLTEDLIDALSITPGLLVRPRAAVAGLKAREADPREVGRQLDVQVVIDGTVRRVGGDYRVSARMLSVADGFQLWTQRFVRPTADLLVVSDEMVRAIAHALTTERAVPPREAPADPHAIDLYLRARAEMRGAWHTSTVVARTAGLFDEALRLAPDDPMILAAGAVAHARLAFLSGEHSARSLERARTLAERAVARAPHVGDGWLALAMVHVNGHDPAGAVGVLRKTLTVAPIMAKAHEILGRILSDAGALDEAIERLEGSLKLDPTHTEPRYDLARAYALLDKWDKVDELLALPIDEGPTQITGTFTRLRLALWRRGPRPAGGPPPDGPPLDPDPPRSVIRAWEWLHATGRLHSAHHTFFQEMTASQSPRLRSVLAQFYTEMLLATGDLYGARGALGIAVDAGLYDLAWMDRCPLLERLRGDPTWPDLRARVEARAAAITRAFGEEPTRGTPTPRG